MGYKKAVIVSDDIVYRKYGKRVTTCIEACGINTEVYVFKNGEKSKNFDEATKIIDFLAEKGINRNDVIISLGGGVVSDMTGFVAAIYKRGIDVVHIPTTLMAMVDASIGGKTAVNTRYAKNLAGAFKQPRFVFCDTKIIEELPRDIFTEGISEVIKYGIIEENTILDELLQDNLDIKKIVTECVGIKARYVEVDEFDRGIRQKLNFGHTVGHAVEQYTDYKLSHGKSVAIGLALETKLAERIFNLDNSMSKKIVALLKKYALPYEISFDIDEIIEYMTKDKKNTDSGIKFILPKKIGNADIYNLNKDTVKNILGAIK